MKAKYFLLIVTLLDAFYLGMIINKTLSELTNLNLLLMIFFSAFTALSYLAFYLTDEDEKESV